MGAPRWGAGAGRAVAELGLAKTGAEVGGAGAVSACGRRRGQSGRRDGWRGVEAEWEVEEKLSAKADQGMEKEEAEGKNQVKSFREQKKSIVEG